MSLDTGSRPRRDRRASPGDSSTLSTDNEASSASLPLVVAGALGGAGAAALSLAVLSCLTLTAWMLDPGADLSWSTMLEAAAGAFLLGQGVPLTVDSVSMSLPPLGFALLSMALVAFGARWAARASAVGRRGEAITVACSAAVGYGAVSALAAELARAVGASPLTAFLACTALAFAVSCLTILRSTGVLTVASIPTSLRDASAAAVSGIVLLLGAGALLVAAAVLVNFADVGLLLGELHLGLSGALLLTVVTLGYLPVACVWATAYLLGPGFVVSSGSVIGPLADASSTTLPGLPLLAALPEEAPAFGVGLPALAIGCGAVVGLLLRRRGHRGLHGVGLALGAAAMSGVVLAVAAWLSSGSLGMARLAFMGPSPLLVGLAAFVTLAIGAALVVPWPAKARHVELARD